MKQKYIGTKITQEAHKDLRIAAAQEGESVSSLLKRLCLDFIATHKKKGGAKSRTLQTP